MNRQELYRAINPLSDERRIEARARARAIVTKDAGEQPERSAFSSTSQGKYPSWMSRLIIGLCLIVLAAAFSPSAIRLYSIGSTTFAAAIPHSMSATAAGISVVIMAETAQILFSLAAAVMHTSRTARVLLYGSMAAATLLALVGNGQVSLPGHELNPFAWFEAFLPPLLVLSTAYILKEQMLGAIEQRHTAERAYQEALQSWKDATAQPERSARYTSALANSLRDAIKEDNSKGAGAAVRKDLMASLTLEHWKALVWREIEADNWYSTPAQAEPLSEQTEQSEHDTSLMHETKNRSDAHSDDHLDEKQPRRRRSAAPIPEITERPTIAVPSINGTH